MIVKNERPNIAEWIAYQFTIGFDCVIILDNNSVDGTKELALSAARDDRIHVIDWNTHDQSTQLSGYKHVCDAFKHEFDWIAFTDSDEFIVPRGHIAISDLVARHADKCAIGINWLVYGSAHHETRPEGLVLESFLYRGAMNFSLPGTADCPNRHIKSIVRPDHVSGCGNPHFFFVDQPYVDVAGNDIAWGVTPGVARDIAFDAEWYVHHYYVRSKAQWQEKIRRGYFDGTIRAETQFAVYDRNEVYDPSAMRFVAAVRSKANQIELSAGR